MKFTILHVALIMLGATVVDAATWNVRKDGTGDFAVIQSALDVAASGDTILIGPGNFTEFYDVRYPWLGYAMPTYAYIEVDAITIIGAGANATIIGPTAYAANRSLLTPEGIACRGGGSVTLVDLCVRNCYSGVTVDGQLNVERCAFDGNSLGLFWIATGQGGIVRDSVFIVRQSLDSDAAFIGGSSSDVKFTACEFTGCRLYFQGAPNFVVTDSRFTGRYAGVTVDGSQGGLIERCVIRNEWSTAIGLVFPGSQCTIRDSDISAPGAAIALDAQMSIVVDGGSLTGGTRAVIDAGRADAVTVNDCVLHKGTGQVIICARAVSQGAVIYDLTRNDWGTTNPVEIESWITDSADNAAIAATVLYAPFAGAATSIEPTTWGELKAMFR